MASDNCHLFLQDDTEHRTRFLLLECLEQGEGLGGVRASWLLESRDLSMNSSPASPELWAPREPLVWTLGSQESTHKLLVQFLS